MKDPWRYRNKVQQPVGWDGKQLISGFYAEGSHEIVPIEDCLVQPELSVKIINRAKALLEQHGLRAYDPKRHQGWIRHLLVSELPKRGRGPKAHVSVFVTRTPDFPHESRDCYPLSSVNFRRSGRHSPEHPARPHECHPGTRVATPLRPGLSGRTTRTPAVPALPRRVFPGQQPAGGSPLRYR